eukprot:TRINITY_DN56782_c0_g1_i1.p1 TRINITY_DN56782_c0_g1~~TRINITY_DN56782_c0_g1_i1.p1  ORF type:complete len:563 (-),score=63.50 TRINITY_DN56782_c0_g1_i1:340-1884(-)
MFLRASLFLASFALGLSRPLHGFSTQGVYGALNIGHFVRTGQLPVVHGPEFLNFTEAVVDHFTPQPSFWTQRFLVNDRHFNGKGPIFLMLGGEGPMSADYADGHFIIADYAALLGGMVVALEHRYYGASLPDPTNTTSTTYLSSRQAILDVLTFQKWFVSSYPTLRRARGAEQGAALTNAPWIVVGGSYSGALAAWVLQAAAGSFVGALASSAPVVATVSFPEYLDTIAESLATPAIGGSSTCSAALVSAVSAAAAAYKTADGRAQLTAEWRTCQPLHEGSVEEAAFLEAIADTVAFVVQYNNDNRHHDAGEPAMPTVQQLCQQAVAGGGRPAFLWLLNQTDATCLDASWQSALQDVQSAGAGRSWTWQTCTEFGFFQIGANSSRTSPNEFPAGISLDLFELLCSRGFAGLSPASVSAAIAETNVHYGERAAAPWLHNVFFTNGKIDPWHRLGVVPSSLAGTIAAERGVEARLMETTAHCADLYPRSKGDPAELEETRVLQLAAIRRWLASRRW